MPPRHPKTRAVLSRPYSVNHSSAASAAAAAPPAAAAAHAVEAVTHTVLDPVAPADGSEQSLFTRRSLASLDDAEGIFYDPYEVLDS